MLSGDSVWMLRAKMRQEARWQARETSITQYAWPSGRCYRVLGDDSSRAHLSCCVSLHANRSEAARRDSAIGSAFFVEVLSEGSNRPGLFAVTAAEVIRDENIGDHPVIRIDHKNGKFQMISTRRKSWRIDSGENLAVMMLERPPLDFSYVPVSSQSFVTREFIEQKGLRVGQTVFVPEPSRRSEESRGRRSPLIFGNICGMPAESVHGSQRRSDLNGMISMEFRSTFARPGSPVFLSEPPAERADHRLAGGDRVSNPGAQLLGVYLGPTDDECLVAPIWNLLAILDRRSKETGFEAHSFSGGYQSNRRSIAILHKV